MIAVYGLAGLFIGWLVVILYRVRRMALSCKATGGYGPNRLAVLVQDQADGVEGLVHRLAAGSRCCPELPVALVDGGSADETGLILERLARRYNMEFYQFTGGGLEVDRWPARCLDLRGLAGKDLLNYNLSVIT